MTDRLKIAFDAELDDWYAYDPTTLDRMYFCVGDWVGYWSVSVQKYGDAAIYGETFESIWDAYDAFWEDVDDLTDNPAKSFLVTLSTTWQDDTDGYCWGSRPVMCFETDTGALTIYDHA